MQSVLFCSSLFLVLLSHFLLLNGAPSSSQCSDQNLAITGGNYSLTDSLNDGSKLRYICPVGFYPHPVKMRECSRGQWDPSPGRKPPVCKKVTCPNPNVLENGVVRPYKPFYSVNDTTTYKCNSDYTFRGSATRVCQANGKWSGGTPICSQNSDHCPDPGTPPGASREGHIFNTDYKVTYTCGKNLKLIGSKVRVCLDGGYWSGREPECYADFAYDTPEEVAEAFSSSLKTTIAMQEDLEDSVQAGKKIRVDREGKIDIYIALDASDSIDETQFKKSKDVIKKLIEKISYYEVSPNYEIIIFATDVKQIVKLSDYKRQKDKTLADILKVLDDYKYDDKGEKSGTNIRKAYETILSSMSLEKEQNKCFNETQHVVIMFTDGIANMGGNPKPVIDQIKQLVYDGDKNKRDKYLDLYAFGVGQNAKKDQIAEEDQIDEWVTKRDNEKYFFRLQDIKDVETTLDEMIDESTSVSLCGLYKDLKDFELKSTSRLTYPWLIKISTTHDHGTSHCIGSLVTPKFILTAAHCFRFDDDHEKILLVPTNSEERLEIRASRVILHPDYDPKQIEGISEYYENDVALIELQKSVKISAKLRTICLPCTQETNAALQLSASDATCDKHREVLLNSDLVKAHFIDHTLLVEKKTNPKKKVKIRQGQEKDSCIEFAQRDEHLNKINITTEKAKKIYSNLLKGNSFLCTGGPSPNFIDDVTCKGDSGGPTFVDKNRLIQVGVISWGLVDICKEDKKREDTRDFHTNLFSQEVRDFLRDYLGNENIDTPLHFL